MESNCCLLYFASVNYKFWCLLVVGWCLTSIFWFFFFLKRIKIFLFSNWIFITFYILSFPLNAWNHLSMHYIIINGRYGVSVYLSLSLVTYLWIFVTDEDLKKRWKLVCVGKFFIWVSKGPQIEVTCWSRKG